MDKNKKGSHPKAALVEAPIYHYGHVRSTKSMREKNKRIAKMTKPTTKNRMKLVT
jgi:tartrate dehydratase beta subunit/fumarate hydratase class I family protein